MTRSIPPVLALAAVAALLAPGCKRELPPSAVIYARGADAKSLDPQAVDDGESAHVIENVYEGLVAFGSGTTQIVPALAEKWETSPDGLVWTFRMRPGVQFHDGTPVDAEAVRFTMQRLFDASGPTRPPEVPYREYFTGCIASIEAPDPATVVFRLKEPYAPFLPNLCMFSAGIVSPTAVKASGGADFGKKPVGAGPFRFLEWNVGEKKITLVRNEKYWRGAPALEKVVFLTIPDNNARLSALRAGSCNWMTGLNPEDLEACRKDPKLKLWTAPAPNVGYLAMNTLKEPFTDVRVRRAVSLAVDRKKLVDALYFGAGIPAVHPMAPGTLGYDESVPLPAPDPAKAKALLAEAGFPEGFDTELYCMPNPRPYYPNPQKIAQVLKSDLAAVGIRATINPVGDWAAYLEAVQNGKHPMCMLGWTGDNGDPDNFLSTFFGPGSVKPGKGALGISFWSDPRMQDLLKQGTVEIDPAKRAEIYRKALALAREEVPLVPVAHAEQVFLSTSGFQGFVVQPTGDLILYPVRPASAE
jgi:peptide/nickel transport system substrate-binding protein